MNDRVKDLLNRGNFDLALSLDSVNKEKYLSIRKNSDFEKVMANLDYFNDYCRSRNKAMSFSTTLMRLNWEDVPEMIHFANSKGAQTFFSYLTRPEHLGLYNLEPEELHGIREKLSRYDFPEDTMLQKYNKFCFNDFITQLQIWEENNLSARIKKKKTAASVTASADTLDINCEVISQEKDDLCYIINTSAAGPEDIFFMSLSQFVKKNYNLDSKSIEIKTRELMEKFDRVLSYLLKDFSNDDIFSYILQTPLKNIIYSLEKEPEDLLRKYVKRNLEDFLSQKKNNPKPE